MRKGVLAIAAATVLTVGVVGGVATARADGNCATKTFHLTASRGAPVHYSPSGTSSIFAHAKHQRYTFDHYCTNKHGKRWYQFKGGTLNNGWVYTAYVR
ncbi:MAG TPA: hypothetical protein VE172_10115 [Stackebrandtia sp.]|jgi:hypothetical protein|uniref:hypothetical protein n=1 Tax=Stackebrandtia sp. TaxID=2023065 RepID=UPI002D25643A|nr:hypothetical protein [Stackebrandtia sp.]HZE39152.1 hypothetical protein [Stackebrandtia sp.]